jgi:hypothetical protein
MCMSCVTNIDALAVNALAGSIFAANAWERISDRRRGITRLERAQRIWLRNQSFMRELGLDPVAVLGPPPGVEVEAAPDQTSARAAGAAVPA